VLVVGLIFCPWLVLGFVVIGIAVGGILLLWRWWLDRQAYVVPPASGDTPSSNAATDILPAVAVPADKPPWGMVAAEPVDFGRVASPPPSPMPAVRQGFWSEVEHCLRMTAGFTLAVVGGAGALGSLGFGVYCIWSAGQVPATPPVKWATVEQERQRAVDQAWRDKCRRIEEHLVKFDRVFGVEARPAAIAWATGRVVAIGYTAENPAPEDLALAAISAAYWHIDRTKFSPDVDAERLLLQKVAEVAGRPPEGEAPLEEIIAAAQPDNRPPWGQFAIASFVMAGILTLVFFGGLAICRA